MVDPQGHRQVLEDMQDAIAVATGDLGLLPGVAFQGRVAQLAQLNAAHQTVSIMIKNTEMFTVFNVNHRSEGPGQ